MSLSQLFSESRLVFREDAVRLGFFVGGFTGLFKAVEGSLDAIRAAAQRAAKGAASSSSSSSATTPDAAESITDEGYLWDEGPPTWHAFAAGTLASVSVLVLDSERRQTLALYVWARAMQCLYNFSKARGWWHFWGSHWDHGDTLLFAVSSAQVMYAYVMRPETLPPSYNKFIVNTGPISEFVLQVVRDANRGKAIDVKKVLQYVTKKGYKVPPGQVILPSPHPHITPCSVLHPQNELCSVQFGQTFTDAFRRTFPLYFSLNVVPAVVLRFMRFVKTPLAVMWGCVTSASRSTTFLASFVAIYMGVICGHRKIATRDNKLVYWFAGFIASLSLLIEKKSRRSELALYALPRAADSLFMIMRKHRLMYGFPKGEVLLFALSMGTVMHFFRHKHSTMSQIFFKIMRRFVGDDETREQALDTPRSGGSARDSTERLSDLTGAPTPSPPLLSHPRIGNGVASSAGAGGRSGTMSPLRQEI